MHSQLMFNECIARSSDDHVHNIPMCPEDQIRSIGFVRSRIKDRSILPPSIGHGEEIAAHQTASSFAALQHTLKLPSERDVKVSIDSCQKEVEWAGSRLQRESVQKDVRRVRLQTRFTQHFNILLN